MNIQYYGHSCFKITTKPGGRATEDVVVFIDPFEKSVGLKPPFGQADVVFVSHGHTDHNNISSLKGDPVVINIPGEYAVKGINAVGIDTFHDKKEGAERGRNTLFVLESEDIKICHLGDLGELLTPKQIEILGQVDVLFIPVGGKYTLDGKEASELTRRIEPKIVIPMHYKMKETTLDISDEKDFCKEIGNCPSEKVSRINFKKKDIDEKISEVVLMKVE